MESKIIKAVYCPDRQNGAEPAGGTVGYGDVTKIEYREQNLGTYGIGWYDVYRGDKLTYSINAMMVEAVYYAD